MGVRKLQTFMEKNAESSFGKGFREVSLKELKEEYSKKYPNSPIEILVDVECCMRYIFPYDIVEYRYGGERVTIIELLRSFFNKFNELGIKIVSFFGNYTQRKKRTEWIRRRYETIDKINKLFRIMNSNNFKSYEEKESLLLIPPCLSYATASIIKYILQEKVIQSLSENDSEIITYAKLNNSFGILSQDSDFIIANAAKYYFSMKHLNLNTMRTFLYDGKVLADMHGLQMCQLPLYASLLGTDLVPNEILMQYHNRYFRKTNGKYDVSHLFRQIANDIRNINCDNYIPRRRDLFYVVRNLGNKSYYNFDEIVQSISESIQSYYIYEIEPDLYISRIKDAKEQERLKLALILYRQCYITSDLLMLISTKTMEMSTCAEIFHPKIKPVGFILQRLRSVLYSATFAGETNVSIEEYIVTHPDCFDTPSAPKMFVQPISFAQPLVIVWKTNLEINPNPSEHYIECYDKNLTMENITYQKIKTSVDTSKEYFIEMFSQSCSISNRIKNILLTKFKQELPPSVQLPLFTFIYLDSNPHSYLHCTERDAVLFTFITISILKIDQINSFSHPLLIDLAENVKLIRACNLFIRACQLMIHINAVCGFPMKIQWLDGHNYWEGKFCRMFYNFLNNQNKNHSQLVEIITEVIRTYDCTQTLNRFENLVQILKELNLINTN